MDNFNFVWNLEEGAISPSREPRRPRGGTWGAGGWRRRSPWVGGGGKCLNKNYYYINFSITVVDTVAQQTYLDTGIAWVTPRWTTGPAWPVAWPVAWPSARASFDRRSGCPYFVCPCSKKHILSVINKCNYYNFTYWKQWLPLFWWITHDYACNSKAHLMRCAASRAK